LLNREKCVFNIALVDFLGHRVSSVGIALLQSRVSAVEQFPQLKTMKQLMSFLGMLNFYRRFLPGAAKVLKPLTDSLKGSKATAAAVEWTEEKTAAFESAKQLLARAACLAHPEPQAQLCLAVDASDSHIGGVLQQASRLGFQTLAFFFKEARQHSG
jgi:hypothetical protein